jgi:predicted nucleic acid-binding protein
MPFVVDASVAACWILADESHPVADAALARLDDDAIVAPSLWWFETRNLVSVNERRGRLDATTSAEARRLLANYPVAFDTEIDEEALMRLARRRRLTVYDAAYLELALRKEIPLATLDRALAEAARAEGAALIESA